MENNIKLLRALKAQAQRKLEKAKREIEVYERKLLEAEGKREHAKCLRTNSVDAEYYMSLVERILSGHDIGLSTKEAHHLVEVMDQRDLNYNTFRSYLNRMKKRALIVQDKNRRWHLKN